MSEYSIHGPAPMCSQTRVSVHQRTVTVLAKNLFLLTCLYGAMVIPCLGGLEHPGTVALCCCFLL